MGFVCANYPESCERQVQAHDRPEDVCPIDVLNGHCEQVLKTPLWSNTVTQSDRDEPDRGDDEKALAKVHSGQPANGSCVAESDGARL